MSPDKVSSINRKAAETKVAKQIVHVFASDAKAWPLLQHVSVLAEHGGKSIVRSVVYRDERMRNAFDALDASDEMAAAWLALSSEHYFQFALSALHADRGLKKRSWHAYRVTFSAVAEFEFDASGRNLFEIEIRDAIRKIRALDRPGQLEVHHFNRFVFPEYANNTWKDHATEARRSISSMPSSA